VLVVVVVDAADVDVAAAAAAAAVVVERQQGRLGVEPHDPVLVHLQGYFVDMEHFWVLLADSYLAAAALLQALGLLVLQPTYSMTFLDNYLEYHLVVEVSFDLRRKKQRERPQRRCEVGLDSHFPSRPLNSLQLAYLDSWISLILTNKS
jgi:hypothetical protein